ncbi:MAG TPA: hypothetical protein PLX89_27605 [Verrucomicrobiota bacterium]|nr:hypothetical protein [Verrucomicrobiales bacterium]HRI16776.1 hypothetical protein [Verrucomicrobiota bacterium]
MSQVSTSVFVAGAGAVSPAGWGVAALTVALEAGVPLPEEPLAGSAGSSPALARRVPAPVPRPPYLAHPRLRRSSAVSHFAVGAALESLGGDAVRVTRRELRLGIVCAVMSGGVTYSRRFYAETLENAATASPMLFPETVFNAPASHVGAVLGTSRLNYTLVGDQTAFVQGLALAADWLRDDEVDGCVVVASEEADWLTTAALKPFRHTPVPGEGAGAVYLRREPANVELTAVSDPELFTRGRNRAEAWTVVRDQLASVPAEALWAVTSSRVDCSGPGWPARQVVPSAILGEGLAAAGAWSCVAAASAVASDGVHSAWVAVAGSNLQAIGAAFSKPGAPGS